MAATVDIYEFTSASAGVSKTSTSVRFKKANNTTIDANNPIIKPSAGNYDRSFFKYIGLYMSAAPVTSVGNCLFWFGTIPTGAEYRYVQQAPASWATPAQAVAADDSTGYTLADGTHASSTNKLTLLAGTTASSPSILGDMVKLFLRVSSTIAGPGVLTGTPLNFSYDEI